jgi:dipeptidyl aminopeptidase/acylaminoacyl peptidase
MTVGFIVSAIVLAVVAFPMASSCGDGGTSTVGTTTPTFGPVGTITTGGLLAFIGSDGNLTLINPDGSGMEAITEGGGVQHYEWSPDGSLIAVQRQDGDATRVEVVRAGGEAVFDIPGAAAPLWSPPGDRLLVAQGDGLDVVDSSGQAVLSIPSAVLPDWASDGTAIAFIRTSGGGKGVPMVINMASGEERALDAAITPDEAIFPVLWHPGGTVIGFRNALYEPANGTKTDLPGPLAYFSPDGRLALVILGPDPTVTGRPARLLDLTQGAKEIIGLDVRPAPDETPPWLFISRWTDWSREGRLLFYMDPDELRPRVRVYDTVAITQDAYRNIRGENPDLSPDGSVAAFQYEGKVWVFALDASALVPLVEGSLPAWQPVP